MENLTENLSSLTEFLRYYAPWIAVTGLLLGLISVTNSILNLRSRYRDWRTVRSQKAFNKGLREFTEDLRIITEYHDEPSRLLTYLLEQALIPALSLLVILFLLIAAVYEIITIVSEGVVEHTLVHFALGAGALVIAWLLLLVPFRFLVKVSVLLSNYNHPKEIVLRAKKVLGTGVKKNYLTKAEAKSVLDTFGTIESLPDSVRREIESF